MVCHYWPRVGGVEKYIHELTKALLDMGHQVEVVAGAHQADLPERETHEGVRIHRYPARRSPLRCRSWLWRNRRLFTRADVVHVSNTHVLEYLWRMLGPVLKRRKIFLTRHGMSCIYPVPQGEKRRARRSLQLAAGVVHDGEFIGKWLGVKPDLCPDQGLAPPAEELAPVPEPPPTSAVFIGRLEPDSGIRIYFEGMRILTREQHRKFHLEVYGGGSLLEELRDVVVREGLPVTFHGPVPNAQEHLVDGCFAFIDGRMAMQEAMARRRLVLAGHPDPLKRDYVCGEPFSPFLVPVANGAELADRVAYYIDHPEERAALVRRAYEHVLTLTWPRTAQAYLDFWRERLARQAPPRAGGPPLIQARARGPAARQPDAR